MAPQGQPETEGKHHAPAVKDDAALLKLAAALDEHATRKEKLDAMWGEAKPWAATTEGRIAINLFSRAFMGAAFYVLAGAQQDKALKGYTANHGFSSQDNLFKKTAWVIDNSLGKLISAQFGEEAVTFRGKRSLGHEMIAVSWDFFAMSVGNGIGQKIASVIDPNVEKPWLKNGHFDVKEFGIDMAKTAWTLVTYKGGEDLAVALPYVYYMKMERSLLDRISPGFAKDFDKGKNGGSLKLDENYNVVGSYALEGALNFTGRFSFYNFLTHIYRDAYNEIGKSLKEWKDSGFKLPELPKSPDEALHGAVDGMGNALKYAVRTGIKTYTYMIPACLFFSPTRAAQGKDAGEDIVLRNVTNGDNEQVLRVKAITIQFGDDRTIKESFKQKYSSYLEKRLVYDQRYTADYADPTAYYEANPQGKWMTALGRVTDKVMAPLGLANYRMNQMLVGGLIAGASLFGFDAASEEGKKKAGTYLGYGDANIEYQYNRSDDGSWSNGLRRFGNASAAYYPYMLAKAEFSARLDTPQMDEAINHMIDGVTHLDMGKFKQGAALYGKVVSPFHKTEDYLDVQLRAMSSVMGYGDTAAKAREKLKMARSVTQVGGMYPAQETVVMKENDKGVLVPEASVESSAPSLVSSGVAVSSPQMGRISSHYQPVALSY
jgi:hypothetical protein